MNFEKYSEKNQEPKKNDNQEKKESEMENEFFAKMEKDIMDEFFAKIKKDIEVTSWFTPHLPEGKSLNNSYLKYEVNTLVNILKKYKPDGVSDEYKRAMKDVAEKIKFDLKEFNTGGLDRNDKGIVISIFKNMDLVSNMIFEENESENGKTKINEEEASKFDEFVEYLNDMQRDIQEILSVEEGLGNKHNYSLKLEIHSLVELLKKQNYYSVPEDCKSLLKEIIETIQNKMNEFDETDIDESSKEKIEGVRKKLADFNKKYINIAKEG
jgi:hypothetical protein